MTTKSAQVTKKVEPAPILARMTDQAAEARIRVLRNIEALGLNDNLFDLETQGFTVLKGVLSGDQITRAKSAILRRLEKTTGKKVDPEGGASDDFYGMGYQPYLIFDDAVFPEILLEKKPLALMYYLLGESCVLSSMGSHFRGPGGLPLSAHVDSIPVGMTDVAMVANCNFALTPYSRDAGALMMFPGSHRKLRGPTQHENWMFGGETVPEVVAKNLPTEELDSIEWTAPAGAVTMNLDPGDAVVWHGNSWHAGWRRDIPGARINLACYFCRPYLATQERRGDDRYPEVFESYANDPQFAQLMGQQSFNGWREEGPDLTSAKYLPSGLYD